MLDKVIAGIFILIVVIISVMTVIVIDSSVIEVIIKNSSLACIIDFIFGSCVGYFVTAPLIINVLEVSLKDTDGENNEILSDNNILNIKSNSTR